MIVVTSFLIYPPQFSHYPLLAYHCPKSLNPSGSPFLSTPMSSLVSDVAEGIATALCLADSIAQQSDGPSVIQSSSPSLNLLITGLLYIPTCEPRGKRKRGIPLRLPLGGELSYPFRSPLRSKHSQFLPPGRLGGGCFLPLGRSGGGSVFSPAPSTISHPHPDKESAAMAHHRTPSPIASKASVGRCSSVRTTSPPLGQSSSRHTRNAPPHH